MSGQTIPPAVLLDKEDRLNCRMVGTQDNMVLHVGTIKSILQQNASNRLGSQVSLQFVTDIWFFSNTSFCSIFFVVLPQVLPVQVYLFIIIIFFPGSHGKMMQQQQFL